MHYKKLNESFYEIEGTPEQLQTIARRFTVTDPTAFFNPLVKRGLKSDKIPFYVTKNKKLIIPSGLIQFLSDFKIYPKYSNEFNENQIDEFIKDFKRTLPFKPYDYQELAIKESILKQQQAILAATGSGKSVIIAGITEFFRRQGLQTLILVPNISLTTQLLKDFKSYGLKDLHKNCRLIGGDNKDKIIDTPVTISTWQSMMKIKKYPFDAIIVDECHGLKLDTKMTDIIYKSNARFRIGCTGTMPDDEVSKMAILSCVGAPKRYIKTQGLIERGLATPVHINTLFLSYNSNDKALFKYVGNYAQKLKFVKEHQNRNKLIAKLSNIISQKGNTVIMCSHIQHMKDVFTEIIKLKDPTITVEEKNINSKTSLKFQEKFKVFYIAGVTSAKDREKIIDILKKYQNIILISNYKLFSTGINIKSLKNIIFASPLKSYTTITQSIGRAVRTHVSKNSAEIYDLVDLFGIRGDGKSGIFYHQYLNRVNKSYNSEGFPITERTINI